MLICNFLVISVIILYCMYVDVMFWLWVAVIMARGICSERKQGRTFWLIFDGIGAVVVFLCIFRLK